MRCPPGPASSPDIAISSKYLAYWARLYSQPTAPENSLEPHVARLGRRYRAQHPVFAAGCIVDFALLDEKIVIEVDGRSHASAEAKAKDAARTAKLERLGWTVVRMSNDEALNDPESALQRCLTEARDNKEKRSA